MSLEQGIRAQWNKLDDAGHFKVDWLALESILREILQRVALDEVYPADDVTRYRMALAQMDEAIAAFTGRGEELDDTYKTYREETL